MNNHCFLKVLLVVLVFFLVPTLATAQRNKVKNKQRKVQAQEEKQTKSFLVKNFDSGEVRLNSLSEPTPAVRTQERVPEHRYIIVPKGQPVPNRFSSPEVNILSFRAQPSITRNVLVSPTFPAGVEPDQVLEPTVAVKGNFVFYTANHFAAISTDGGQTFTYVSPRQVFNGTGYTFCCDQVVQYVPQIDMIVWSLQANNYDAQLILYATPENARNNNWRKILFEPSDLNVPRADLDFTDMSFGNNMLYWSTNVFGAVIDNEVVDKSVVVRIPLEGLRTGNPQPRASIRRWGVRLAQNTGDAGYFAAHFDTSTLIVYRWEEMAADPTWKEVTVPSWSHVPLATWGNVRSRVIGATRAGNDLWFTWNADERTPDRPEKYAQVARVNTQNLTLLDSPDLWNNDFRIGLPALTTNSLTNEVGVSYILGRKHHHAVGILTGTRVFFTTAEGGFDAVGSRWGDYLSIRQQYSDAANPQPTGLFAATGYTLTSNSVVQPRFILFSRDQVR